MLSYLSFQMTRLTQSYIQKAGNIRKNKTDDAGDDESKVA